LSWTTGLGRLPLYAKAFSGPIAVATLTGIFINFVGIDPIKALFWAAVLSGVVAVPLMVVIMVMTMLKRVMGACALRRPLWAMGWLSTVVMAVAVGGYVSNLVSSETDSLSQEKLVGAIRHRPDRVGTVFLVDHF
jgi:Mn2+/Fe2+ NRAMP family transporter